MLAATRWASCHGSRLRRRFVVGAAALLLATLGACGGGGSDDGDPLADGDPARGEELFANNCAQCHGGQLQGTELGPPLVHEYYVPSHHGDVAFQAAVQQGVQQHHWEFGPMPAMPALSAEDVGDIVAFVRAEQRAAGLIE